MTNPSSAPSRPDVARQIAEQLLADGWSAAFECAGFEPLDLSGLALPHGESDTCRHCHEARWHHHVVTLCREYLRHRCLTCGGDTRNEWWSCICAGQRAAQEAPK